MIAFLLTGCSVAALAYFLGQRAAGREQAIAEKNLSALQESIERLEAIARAVRQSPSDTTDAPPPPGLFGSAGGFGAAIRSRPEPSLSPSASVLNQQLSQKPEDMPAFPYEAGSGASTNARLN